MKDAVNTALMIYLNRLKDPPTVQNTRHKLIEIVFIAVCAVISGRECWTEIEDYGQAQEQWLQRFFHSRRRHSFSRHVEKTFLYFRF